MTRRLTLILALLSAALLAPPALGAGGPVAGTEAGPGGVTVPGDPSRYTTLRTGGGTLVAQVQRDGGQVTGSRFLKRALTLPAVAYDNSATGLSADGRTLVLATPRSGVPRRRSGFAVLDAQRLRPRFQTTLRGDFTLDAISPDGRRLFFIQYTSRRDFSRYTVRAYDVGARRLLTRPIVDPAEADEPMRGNPVARAMSEDGRWAYTLYDGNGEHPFIHALDTVAAHAKCVDLDQLAGRQDLFGLRLGVGRGGEVVVREPEHQAALLTVDPRTFAVRAPAPVLPPRARTPQPAADDGAPWLAIALAGAMMVLMGVGAGVLRRGRAYESSAS
jgi:hypothetical protein